VPAYGVYLASRAAATDVLTRALAVELRARHHGQRIALAAAGPCLPHRIADVVAYLLSDDERCLTGQVICIDPRDGLWPPATPR
jgi:hypothetical protein